MKKIKVFRKKYPAPEEMVHGSHSRDKVKYPAPEQMVHGGHSSSPVMEQDNNKSEYENYIINSRPNDHLHLPSDARYYQGVERSLSQRQNFDDLTPEERTHVKEYSLSSSDLNRFLIHSYNNNENVTGNTYNGSPIHIGSLDSATKRFTLPKMSLFHGASFDPTRLGKPTSDGHHIVHIPAYTSTSYNHLISAETFSRPDHKSQDDTYTNMLEIKVPEGHPGLHIGPNGVMKRESEVLLPRGMTLKIKSTPTAYKKNISDVSSIYPGGNGLKVWEAHPVPDGEDPETWQPPSK